MKINILGMKINPIARDLFVDEWKNRRGELVFFGLRLLAAAMANNLVVFLNVIGGLTIMIFYGFTSEELSLLVKIITAIKSTLKIYAVSVFTVSTVIMVIHSSLRHLYVAAESGYKSLYEYSMSRNADIRLHNGRAHGYKTNKGNAKKSDSL